MGPPSVRSLSSARKTGAEVGQLEFEVPRLHIELEGWRAARTHLFVGWLDSRPVSVAKQKTVV